MPAVETGHLHDRLPYVRTGSGPATLVIVPGLEDSMFGGRYTRQIGWLFRWYVSRFRDRYTVYLVSRPRGLPDDATIERMAADYEAVLDEQLGSAAVVGISMGGMIAQSLAADRPDLVDQLVLANTGHRIDAPEAVERLRQYARARNWAAIRARLATAMFSDWRATAYPLFARTIGRTIQPRPADPADVEISLDAIEAFDARSWLSEIEPPTLLFGGTADPYFPPQVTEATVDGIDDAELVLIPGAKHAAFHEFKATFDSTVDRFLAASPRRRRPAQGS